tara:strand:- start:538 stop:1401 length:864 start_codon:yes stop_codon:yes gene_type:complete
MDGDGFVRKRRARAQTRARDVSPPKGGGFVDFAFENPLHGKFKDLPSVMGMLFCYPSRVRRIDTSYCNLGFRYQKPTVIITSLTRLRLPPPCPKHPCAAVRAGLPHAARVAECDDATKNALPPALVDALVEAWLRKHADAQTGAEAYLLIDVFAGFGSVHGRVRERWPQVCVYANDLVDRGQDGVFDMSANSPFGPDSLLALALVKLFHADPDALRAHAGGAVGWANAHKIAVLFHISTPCETYSSQALAVHREAGTCTAVSRAAHRADAMNDALVAWLERVVLSPD